MRSTICATDNTRVVVDETLAHNAAIRISIAKRDTGDSITAWLDIHGAQALADSIYILLGKPTVITVPIISSDINWHDVNEVARGNV